jgi:hypothetical protein
MRDALQTLRGVYAESNCKRIVKVQQDDTASVREQGCSVNVPAVDR